MPPVEVRVSAKRPGEAKRIFRTVQEALKHGDTTSYASCMLSARGSAIPISASVATRLHREGLANIGSVQTALEGTGRGLGGVATIRITVFAVTPPGNGEQSNAQTTRVDQPQLNADLLLKVTEADVVAVRELCAAGADVNTHNRHGMTPMHRAARCDHLKALVNKQDARSAVQVLKLLAEHGADVNAKDAKGSTALHIASEYAPKEVVACLLDLGVEVNAVAQTSDGPSSRISSPVAGSLARGGLLSPKKTSGQGATALDVAQQAGRSAITSLLIEKGAISSLISPNGTLH